MKCPLCNNDNLNIIQKIKKKDLVYLYSPINICDDLKDDEILQYKCNNCTLIFFDPKNAGGEKFYSELAEKFINWYYNHPGKTEYDFIQNFIKDGDVILDIGAGNGELFKRISKKVDYLGLELSITASNQAKSMNINVINEDLLLHQELNSNKYDLVCLFQVLEHLTEIDTFIKAINNVLKKGGYFCIAVPNNESFLRDAQNNYLNLPPHHTIHWKNSSLFFLANKYDFEIVNVEFENLQQVHFNQYIGSKIKKLFYNLFLTQMKIVNVNNLMGKLIDNINALIYKFGFYSLFKFVINNNKTKGQSVIYLLRKK